MQGELFDRAPPAPAMVDRVFTVLFPFCGVGGAALGFQGSGAEFRKLGVRAGFRVVGGIEMDESTADDFKRLTGAPCLTMDVCKITPAMLRAWFGDRCPDVIFFSPPCKGGSGLLSAALAKSEKYEAMNGLCMVWLRLMFETWSEGPLLLLMENVPNLKNRAKAMFQAVRALLASKGYVSNDEAHDCGVMAGLAQHRKRLLLVARHAARVPALLYHPVPRKVRPVSAVLAHLPLPHDPAGGPLHRLPAIDAMTALRLALIPAGKDWKALPSRVLLPPELAKLVGGPRSKRTPFNDVWRIMRWDSAAPCVTSGATPSAGGTSVADPRSGYAHEPRDHDHGVLPWCATSGTVTTKPHPSNGRSSVADPRAGYAHEPRNDDHGVLPWTDPAGTVTGKGRPSNGRTSVADPRAGRPADEARNDDHGVLPWTDPAGTVTGQGCPSNGRNSVADPRTVAEPRPTCAVDPQFRLGPHAHTSICAVQAWSTSARTVTGATRPAGGAPVVADPRLTTATPEEIRAWTRDGTKVDGAPMPFKGKYEVQGWEEPSRAIIGGPGNGGSYVADPGPSEGRPAAALVAADPQVSGKSLYANNHAVLPWSSPARTVAGQIQPGSGAPSAADPRPAGADDATPYRRYGNNWRVEDWAAPAHTVTGSTDVQEGAPSVSDPRAVCGFNGTYGVVAWDGSVGAITSGASASPATGRFTLADPRPAETCHPHTYGVLAPSDTAHTITASTYVGCGPFSYADARVTTARDAAGDWGVAPLQPSALAVSPAWLASLPFPFILAADGTWHRPLTTYECAMLQSFPEMVDGERFSLAGTREQVRVKVGDAVPVLTATRIGDQCLYTLLDAEFATWTPTAGGVWVRPSSFDDADVWQGDA